MARKRSPHIRRFNLFDVFVLAFTISFGLVCVYPMWFVLIASIMPYDEFVRTKILLLPTLHPDFQYYRAILSTEVFTSSVTISVAKTLSTTLLSLFVTATMAYAVSKTEIKGMKVINALVVFNLFFAGGLIPEYLLYRDIGILRHFSVMVLPSALNIIYFIIMRNYFANSVPADLEQAAKIDGAQDITIFFRIIVPLSKAMFAAVGLFIAVWAWNDYYTYMMFVSNKPALQPFAWILRRTLVDPSMMAQIRNQAQAMLQMQNLPPPALRMTTIILAMVPIMAVYPFLQKHFAKGILIGAVKEEAPD